MPVVPVVGFTPTYAEAESHAWQTSPPQTEAARRQTAEALERAIALCRPVTVWEWYRVAGANGHDLALSGPNGEGCFRFESVPDRIGLAKEVLLSVCTVGPLLEREVARLAEAGSHLESFLLDTIGLLFLAKAEDACRVVAARQAREKGWGVGVQLVPGSTCGWPLREQAELARLLPVHLIDVQVDERSLLVPFKSTSSAIAIGPAYEGYVPEPPCVTCPRAESCRWKRAARG